MAKDLATSRRSGYIPTLDGWRAVAVLSVVAYHSTVFHIGPFSDAWIHDFGFLGVDLFFAISGLLICARLLEEEQINYRISLKAFYIRRFCRILPPAFLYLTILTIFGLAHVVRVDPTSWFCSLFFVNNYYFVHLHGSDVAVYTNHFWSLAVEEHFYLLFPGILCLFPRRRIQVLGLLILAFLVFSAICHADRHWMELLGGNAAYARTEFRLNALLFPALLAVLLRRTRFRAFCATWATPLFVILLFGFALVLFLRAGVAPADWLVVPFGLPFLVAGTSLRPSSDLSRVLEFAPLRFLGRISYSIYLWQELFFIGRNVDMGAAWPMGLLQSLPWNLAAVLLVATFSYFFIEKPFIRLGHRLAPPATPGHPDLETRKTTTLVAG